MLTRGADAGTLALRLSPEATMNALTGPIVYNALTGSDTPGELIDTLVDALIRPAS